MKNKATLVIYDCCQDMRLGISQKTLVFYTHDRNESLTKLEMKLYQKMTGKIDWLANYTRPDLCYQALQMSKMHLQFLIQIRIEYA